MGVSKSPAELAAKFQRIANMIPDSSAAGVRGAALYVKTVVQREQAGDTGGDRRMSGFGKNGAAIGVSFNVKGRQNPTALVRATGPAHILERGAKPHFIAPKSAGTRRGRAKRGAGIAVASLMGQSATFRNKKRGVVNIPGVGPRAYAFHPGMKGKHTWRRGVEKAKPRVPFIFKEDVSKAMVKVFG